MECISCVRIFEEVGDAFNSTLGTEEKLERVARAIVKHLGIKACHFRVLSRDQRNLEHVASFGLSETFLNKGPVDAERSVAEALDGRLVMVEDCANDPRIFGSCWKRDVMRSSRRCSWRCAPMAVTWHAQLGRLAFRASAPTG